MKIEDLKNAVNLLSCLEDKPSESAKEQGLIEIVVLQRGWVAVGNFYQNGEECRLENASIIRIWGTDKGLGQIAINGPTDKTRLDECGTLRFHPLTIVTRMDTDQEAWS